MIFNGESPSSVGQQIICTNSEGEEGIEVLVGLKVTKELKEQIVKDGKCIYEEEREKDKNLES